MTKIARGRVQIRELFALLTRDSALPMQISACSSGTKPGGARRGYPTGVRHAIAFGPLVEVESFFHRTISLDTSAKNETQLKSQTGRGSGAGRRAVDVGGASRMCYFAPTAKIVCVTSGNGSKRLAKSARIASDWEEV